MPLMSEQKYADYRKARGLPGGSQAAVNKAVKTGRITKVIDPLTKKPKIDPVIADAQWERNTDLEQQLRGNGGVPPVAPAEAPDLRRPANSGASDDPEDDREELLRHKTQSAKADAQLKTMQALERAGALVDAAEVRREAAAIARQLRNAVLAIPDRVAPVLDPANPARAHNLLTAEIAKVLREFGTGLEQRADSRAAEPEEAVLQGVR